MQLCFFKSIQYALQVGEIWSSFLNYNTTMKICSLDYSFWYNTMSTSIIKKTCVQEQNFIFRLVHKDAYYK